MEKKKIKIKKIPKIIFNNNKMNQKKLRAPIHKLGAPWLINYLAYLRKKKPIKNQRKPSQLLLFLSKKSFKFKDF